jgi:micrococcal nuclease
MRSPLLIAVALTLMAWPAIAQTSGEVVNIGALRVVDGDTVVIGRERVRISNLDAPEMTGRSRCALEAKLALDAKDMMKDELFGSHKTVVLVRDVRRPRDKYGRTLAHLTVNGVDVADGLIAKGVARPWRGRSSNWCDPASQPLPR